MNYIICGLDTHDNKIVGETGLNKKEPKAFRIANSEAARKKMYKFLLKLAEEHAAKIIVGYEASCLGYTIHDECKDLGIDCRILAPTKMAQSVKDKKNKSDSYDTRKIYEALRGHVLAGNSLPDIWIPGKILRDDRALVRRRLDVGKEITRVKLKIRMLLKMHGIKRDKNKTGKTTWTKKFRSWLKNDVKLKEGAAATLRSYLRQIDWFEEEETRLDDELYKLSQEPRYKEMVKRLMIEVCGAGLLTTMVFLTQFGDMSRFHNRKEVGSYMGLVPSTFESGNKEDRKGHITKQGPSDVRGVLCQAIWTRIKNDEETRKFYYRICERNPKHKMIAVVACMRKLGILMWHKALEVQQKNVDKKVA